MTERVVPCVYFAERGAVNTDRTLELVQARAQALGIGTIVVATTSGTTALKAVERCVDQNVVVVTHSTGFAGPDLQQLEPEKRAAIESRGGRVLTCQHAFGGVGRAVRKKLATYQVDEIMAYTLRTFCEGIKVTAEICLMAADAGLIRTDEAVIAVAGSGSGADTAVVIKPTHAQTFFDLRYLELICMPSPQHP